MPRPRRANRNRRPAPTEAEQLWALGELTTAHRDYGAVIYLTPAVRLRAVWREVNGEPISESLEEPYRLGDVLLNGARVARLNAEDVELLRLGLDPFAHEQEAL